MMTTTASNQYTPVPLVLQYQGPILSLLSRWLSLAVSYYIAFDEGEIDIPHVRNLELLTLHIKTSIHFLPSITFPP